VRIGSAERLGQDVLDAGRLEDGADRTAGDDTGAFGGRLEKDLARAVVPEGGVRDGRAGHGDLDHVLLGDLDALLDGGRNFLRLAGAEADFALAVADDHERAEAEVLAALDDLRHAVDVDDLVDHPALGSLIVAAIAGRCCGRCIGSPRIPNRFRAPHRRAL
jgi:hypothetical protein